VYFGDKTITGWEYLSGRYGQTRPPQSRGLAEINHSYQTRADNIVGKMTIRRLDDEMRMIQDFPFGPSR
jgi:hypothetical protein